MKKANISTKNSIFIFNTKSQNGGLGLEVNK